MIIGGTYSFNGGREAVEEKYPHLLAEIKSILAGVDAEEHKTKQSLEARRGYQLLYNPKTLNKAFKVAFNARGWINRRVPSIYSTEFYEPGYQRRVTADRSYRDMDFVKEKLGVEVQFGKYSFMVYNVAAKMTIFSNLEIIDTGIEIVPMAQFVKEMSSGVSFFEQFVWDLEKRGTSNIDIPVLILGIDTRSTGEPITLPPELVQESESE